MQLDTALHVFINRDTYPQDQVQVAAMTLSAEMSTHPRLMGLLQEEKDHQYDTMPLGQLVDELGMLKAEEKSNYTKQEQIKSILHIAGERQVDGNLYHATVGEDYTSTTLSLKELEKKNPKLYKQLEPYIKHSTCLGRIIVRAR